MFYETKRQNLVTWQCIAVIYLVNVSLILLPEKSLDTLMYPTTSLQVQRNQAAHENSCSYLHQLKRPITPSVFCTNNLKLQPKSCEPGGFSIVPFVVKINMDEILSSEIKYGD